MTLRDYLDKVLGLRSFAARFDKPDTLALISWFELGPRYDIVMNSGVRITIGDSNTLFAILYTELAASGRHLPVARLYPKDILRVTPHAELRQVSDPELRRALGEIQLWVTEFSLSDEWNKTIPRASTFEYDSFSPRT